MSESHPPAGPVSTSTQGIVVGVGAIIALVVAGIAMIVIGVVVADKVLFGPEKQVEKYVKALEDLDAERVLDLIDGAYGPDESILLTQDVMDSLKGQISDYKIKQSHAQGDQAFAMITYTLDGREQFATVELRRSSSFLGLFDRWEIVDPGLVTVSVRAGDATGVDVNGEVVDMRDVSFDRDLHVFPGRYDITPQTGSKFLAYETRSVSLGSTSESLGFDVEVTEELRAEVAKQADAYLARCIAQRDIAPLSCPNRTFENDYSSVFEDVRWTLTRPPSYSIEDGGVGQWPFSSTIGAADVTARRSSTRDGAPAEAFEASVSFRFSGVVLIKGDVATLIVQRPS
jgi:hypothetical protein